MFKKQNKKAKTRSIACGWHEKDVLIFLFSFFFFPSQIVSEMYVHNFFILSSRKKFVVYPI